MHDENVSREELIDQLADLRQRIETLEAENSWLKSLAQAGHGGTGELHRTNDKLLAEIAHRRQAENALRISEKRFRTLAEASFEGIAVSEKGILLDVNDQLAEMLGYQPKELVGRDLLKFVCPEHRPLVAQGQLEGRLEPYECLMVRSDGSTFPAEIGARWADPTGPSLLITAIRDISESKRAEEELRETNVALEALIQSSPAAIVVLDPSGNVKVWNPAAESMFGWIEKEVMGKPPPNLFEDQTGDFDKLRADVLNGAAFNGLEVRLRRKDDSPIYLSLSVAPLRDTKGDLRGVMTVSIDISRRKRAEEKLRFTQFAMDNSAEAAFWIRSDGRNIYVNNAACRLLGYSREELLSLSIQDIDPIISDKRWADHWAQTSKSGTCTTIETQHRRKDGKFIPVEVRINFVEFEGQGYHCSYAIDITERKKVERALLESMESFQSIVENSLAGIFTIDPAYRFVYVNDELCRILGHAREELLGMDFRKLLADDCTPPVFGKPVCRQRGEETPSRYELKVMCGDNRTRNVEVLVTVVKDGAGSSRTMGQLMDVTERREIEEAVRTSERRLSEALRVARMGCWEFDVPRDLFTFDDQYYSLHRMTVLEARGYQMTSSEFARKYVYPEDAHLVGQAIEQAIKAVDSDYQYQTEARILTGDGDIRWVAVWFRIGKDEQGHTTRLFGVSQDITERKQAEEATRQSEQKYRELVQNANSIILRWNRKGEITFLNEFGQQFFGYSEKEIVGQHVIGTIVPETESGGRDLRPLMQQVCANPTDYANNVNENILRDGTRVWIAWTNRAIFDEQSELIEIFSVGTDITERKRTEAAIRNIVAGVSSEIGLKFFDSMTTHFASTLGADCTFIGECIDIDGTEYLKTLSFCLDGKISDNFDIPLKGSPCEIVLQKGLCSYPRDLLQLFPDDEQLQRLHAEGYVGVQLCDSVGTRLGVLAALYRSPIGDVEFAESILQIFAARAAAEIDRKRVEEERLRLATAIEQAGESILITDPSGRIIYANPAFTSTTGYSGQEVQGEIAAALKNGKLDAAGYEDMWSTIRRGDVWRGRFESTKKDGSSYEENTTISPIKDAGGHISNYVMVGRDITTEVMLQKQLLQAQKMEAIGTLAGGIAHDFNNLLQAILGYADLLLMRKQRDDPDRHKIEIIHHAARDGADLVSRILTFSRKAEAKTRPIDLNAEIRRAEKLLRRTVPKMIDINLQLADDLRIIDADPAQIEQVVLNLGVNAQHAMPEGGRLLIETCNVSLRDDYLKTHADAEKGEFVLLTVSDTGVGITPDLLDRIFDPFFTTKVNGEGTGLGLAMVHGIVSQHGGHIRCYSEPHMGTSFKIYLPVSATERSWEAVETREIPQFGNETILLVDDDDRVRAMATEMIQERGYEVFVAGSGEEAVAIFATHKDAIAVVILDLIMPGMGGKKCLEELLRMDPKVKVLVASGYSSGLLHESDRETGARGFISKPYNAKNLFGAIRKVLDDLDR